MSSYLPFAVPRRFLASKLHRVARGKRLRYGGPIPGVFNKGKPSTEMTYRGEAVLESIRIPKPVVNPIKRWKILRGDYVEVISGPEKGKRGRVIEVVRASNRVVVEGVQMVDKFIAQTDSAGKVKITTEAPIYVSRVSVVCPETGKPTRVGYGFLEDGTKVRIAKRSGAVIPRPEILKVRRKEKRKEDGKKDTKSVVALERTFVDEWGIYGGEWKGLAQLVKDDE